MNPLPKNSGMSPESAASRTLASESLTNSTQPTPGVTGAHIPPLACDVPEDAEYPDDEWERLHEADDENCADFDPIELMYGCK